MPVPTIITDLSQTASSNYPAGTDSPIVLDDVQRAHASFIAMLRDGKGFTNAVTLASGGTTDIGGQNARFLDVSGTTTITSLGTSYNGERVVRFTGALTLTYNATTLVTISGASMTTVAGDVAVFIPKITLDGWLMVNYSTFASQTVTKTAGDNTTAIASTAYVDSASRGASFSAYRNAALSLVTSAITALVCDVSENNLGSGYATGTGIFTCPAGGDGEYQFNAMASFQNVAAAGVCFVLLYKNGVRNKDGAHLILDPSNFVSSGVSSKISLVAGDTVQPYIYQQSGSTIGIGSGNVYTTYFQGYRMRAA